MRSATAQISKSACLAAIKHLRAGEPAAMSAWVRGHLLGHVLPFWERHALDERGGILTCIADNGEVNSTEKWMWSQWRAVWVFSRIHRTVEPHARWLRYAREIADFSIRHAWDSENRQWALLVSASGKVLRGHESTYVDAFAIYGLLELYLASRDETLLRLARETADASLLELAGRLERIPHFPYPIPPGAKPHGIPMMWSLVLAELGVVAGEERYLREAGRLADEVFRDFYRPARGLCVEFVQVDGRELPPPEGTAVVPGHVIEDMWFQIHVAELLGGNPERVRLACDLIHRHLELGWEDRSGGGILLAVDAEGREPVGWKFADTKLWWPHTEGLYSSLLAWRLEGAPRFLDWYERIWNFCLDHYADWKNGEWRQKLDRALTPLNGTIALPVKDPFHLPRSLILQLELLGKMGRRDGMPAPSPTQHVAASLENRPRSDSHAASIRLDPPKCQPEPRVP